MKNKYWIYTLLLVAIGFCFWKMSDNQMNITKKPATKVYYLSPLDTVKLNDQHLLSVLYLFDFIEPEICFKQAIIESKHFHSNIFKTKNNLFAFKTDHYLYFAGWISCVLFYKKYQKKYYHGGDYFEFLKKQKWCTDSNYKLKVNGIKL